MIWLFFACREPKTSQVPQEEPLADVFVDTLGDPVPFLGGELLERFYRGAEVMEQAFHSDNGLGPTFNADSCASCHQGPTAGGSGPKYRDLWLVKEERWDGALINAGTNGASPVRNLYTTAPTFHTKIAQDVDFYARRNTPSGFGVGLFAFIDEDALLASADPEVIDVDGDKVKAEKDMVKLKTIAVGSNMDVEMYEAGLDGIVKGYTDAMADTDAEAAISVKDKIAS